MSLIRKLFRASALRKESERRPIPAKLPPLKDLAKDPNMIRVYDAYGREFYITKEEWRKNVLPGSIQSNWDKPDELYNIIVGALNDGFRSDVVTTAERLFKIDSNRSRGACVWGVVLMEEGRLNDAEKVFRDFIAGHGEDGLILTNLAKVYARRKDDEKAEEILWRALQVDPNQDNGVGCYWIIHKERGGDAEGEDALRRVAALPGSWRAQLWLAREALKRADLSAALTLYEESLAAAPSPIPSDLLMQLSGDLGNAGHLPEILNLTLPRFDVTVHGLAVGNNLIKSMLDLGQIEPARKLLKQLYAQNRLDWKKTLSFWDTELAKARVATTSIEPSEKLSIALLAIEGPVWLPEQSPAHEVFAAPSANAPRISFLGSSADTGHKGEKMIAQMSDASGRFSRGLPLFLAEQVRFNCDANTRTIVPWVRNGSAGFVLSGVPWLDSDAAQYARNEPACDYVVVTHLKTAAEPWTIELRLIRTIDAKCLAAAKVSCSSAQTGDGARNMVHQVFVLLARHAEVEKTSPPRCYSLPAAADLPYYLLRLEQLLAVRCAGMDGVPGGFLSGKREIIDGNIHLCLSNATNVVTRILLLQTLKAMKRVQPDIVVEYRDKLQLLQHKHPLDEPGQAVCQRLLNDLLAS
jgi:tetratricopeptide (TPR) repeat protein